MAHMPSDVTHKEGELQGSSGGYLRISGTLTAQSHQPHVHLPGKLLVSAPGQGQEHLAELATLQGHGAASSVQLLQDGCTFEALLPAFACSDNRELQATIQQLHNQLTSSQKELCGHERRINIIVGHMQVIFIAYVVLSQLLRVMLGCRGLLKAHCA